MSPNSWFQSFTARRQRSGQVPCNRQRFSAARHRWLRLERLEGRALLVAGDLDLSFGMGGKVATDFASAEDRANAGAIQSDGKIVAAGRTGIAPNFDFALVRYNSDGTLDSGFGVAGHVVTDFPGDSAVRDIALQSDGKIVAAGYAQPGDYDFVVARYNPDGSLDTEFGGGDGIVLTDLAVGSHDVGRAVTVLSDGRIVVGGAIHSPPDYAIAVYLRDGTLDTTFGGDGIVSGHLSLGQHVAAIAESDGKILIGGPTGTPTDGDFFLARYELDGTLDMGFETDGIVLTDFAPANVSMEDMIVQGDGKILAVGGYEQPPGGSSNWGVSMARYNPNGTLDSSFGNGAQVLANLGWGAIGVNVQDDGKIVVGGGTAGGDIDFGLARFTSNGILDSNFGSGGVITTDFNGARDVGNHVLIHDDGKIVVIGEIVGTSGGFDFGAARYFGSNHSGPGSNSAPVSTDDVYSTSQSISVSGNVITDDTGSGADSDPDNDPLSVSGNTQPQHGTLLLDSDGSFTYTPESTFSGTDSFTYTISDGDGGEDTATVTITVSPAAAGSIQIIPDTCLGGTALLITGTFGGDHIVVEPGATAAMFVVTINGTSSTVSTPSGRIIVTAGAGNDHVQIAGAISNSAWLYGESGNDQLNAGRVGSLLFGGDGDDQLSGGNGRDVMIGGDGADHVNGKSGDDILLASLTDMDVRSAPNHENYWCQVLEDWNSTNPYSQRVQNLRPILLPHVVDDIFKDKINGSAGNDWLVFA